MKDKNNSYTYLKDIFFKSQKPIKLIKDDYIIKSDTEDIFVFQNMNDIIIDGSDSKFSFGGVVRPFVFKGCNNITIKNLTIDYFDPPYTHGEVLESDGQNFIVKLFDRKANNMPEVKAYLEYDKNTLAPLEAGNDIYWDCKDIIVIDESTVKIAFNNKHSIPPVGTLVVLRHEIYDYDGFTFHDCKDIVFENVKIRCAVGMGVCAYGSDNLKFVNIEIAPEKNSNRLISTTGDGIHLMNCAGEVLVKDSYFAYLGDDSFNSHGMFLKVLSIDGKKIKAYHPKGYNLLPHVGDKLEFTKQGELLPYGTAEVKSVELINNEVVLEIDNIKGDELILGDYLANATRNVQLTYCNNIVENKRCRGILVQTRNAIIKDNIFNNVSGGGILVFSEDISFYESIGTRNIVIENNKLINNNHATGKCQGDISVVSYTEGFKLGGIGVHQNIVIKNNEIISTGFRGIYVACAKNVLIENNNIGFGDEIKNDIAAIKIESSENVILSGNNVLKNNGNNNKHRFLELGEFCKNIIEN